MSDVDEMVAWLRGVLDEDERVALAATPGPWFVHDTYLDLGGHTATVLSGKSGAGELRAWLPTRRGDVYWDQDRNVWNDAGHIARHDPSHVLGIVAAHRKLLDLVAVAEDRALHADAWTVGKEVVQTIAAGYRHREGYRPEWAPQ